MKKKILFTGSGGAGTEAIWRLLSAKYDLYFADADVESIPDCIPFDRKIKIAFAKDHEFIDQLIRTCRLHEIDILVPGVDEELLSIAKNRSLFSALVMLPSASFVELMLDKLESARAIDKAGLSVPKTLHLTRADEIGFPLIVKPRSGRGSRGVQVINNPDEINAYQIMYRVKNTNDIVAQELCVGDEYTVFVAVDQMKNLSAVVPVKVDQKKGVTIRAKIHLDDNVLRYVREFHKAFKEPGVYNIQCIVKKSGEVKPFEVNPRISTTFCLSLAAGFDPFEVIHQWSGETYVPKKCLSLKRNWNNHIF